MVRCFAKRANRMHFSASSSAENVFALDKVLELGGRAVVVPGRRPDPGADLRRVAFGGSGPLLPLPGQQEQLRAGLEELVVGGFLGASVDVAAAHRRKREPLVRAFGLHAIDEGLDLSSVGSRTDRSPGQ